MDVAEWAAQRCCLEVQEWVAREDVPLLVLSGCREERWTATLRWRPGAACPRARATCACPPVMEEVIGQLIAGKDELQRLSEQAVAGVHAREHACACVSVRVSVASLRSARLLTRAAAPCAANSEFIYLST